MNNPHFVQRNKCPACDTTGFRTLYRCPYESDPIKAYLQNYYSCLKADEEFRYVVGAFYHLCECSECKLVFQREIPNENLMKRLYSHWMNPVPCIAERKLYLYSQYAQEILQIIALLSERRSELSFLDYGMGWGKWALMAKAFGCQSWGVELSEDRMEFARANGIKVILHEEIANNHFDFINVEQVFEHLAEPLHTLSYLQESLNANGIIKISVPTANDIERRLAGMNWEGPKNSKNSLNAVAPLEHINCYKRESLVKMANMAGMKEIRIPVSIQYRFMSNWCNLNEIIKNLMRPLYRNLLRKQNYLFFSKISREK